MTDRPPADSVRARVSAIDIVRFVVELAAVASLIIWGVVAWPFPWNILAAVAAPAVFIVVWGLFISRRAVVPLHPFVRAGIELVLFAAVTVAWWSIGQIWVGLAFAVVAVVSGVLSGRERLG